jgi:putative ABC transport system permease protein
MIRLAYRNLVQNKIRLLISTGGVALAFMLILALDAIFSGVEQQITAYIDSSRADIFISQEGVKNMHMATSSLPAAVGAEVEAVPGVRSVTPILYLSNVIRIGEDRNLAYIIGLPEDALAGTVPNIAEGVGVPGKNQAVIDQNVAAASGVTTGDEVEILGRTFVIAGLSNGLSSLVNSVAFISLPDFAEIRGSRDGISFLLVQVEDGYAPEAVSKTIEIQVAGITSQTRQEFSKQERQVVKDMGTDVIAIMNLIGFTIGLAVMALTVYTAILSRRAEYGVLKALGARNGQLYQVVVAQALFSVSLGVILGLLFVAFLSFTIPRLGFDLRLVISLSSLLKVLVVSLLIAYLSAVLPVRQLSRLDPVFVFRGKSI